MCGKNVLVGIFLEIIDRFMGRMLSFSYTTRSSISKKMIISLLSWLSAEDAEKS